MKSNATSAVRWQLFWYGFTVFLSSAILLVLEIVAGRLIAPYVGASLYSWTSIIGVILAGLSIGNWLGGIWADRGGDGLAVGIVLGAGSVFSIASLLILSLISPFIQHSQFDIATSSFFYVLAMFFVPAVLLGVVTPLLTTLALSIDIRTGHVVGRMHALAALGSILGTFLTGYWLVQLFGTRAIILGSAICLFALAIPYLRHAPRLVPLSVFAAVSTVTVLTYSQSGFTSPCDRESNYYCLKVTDARLPFIGTAKGLIIDHLLHSMNAADPTVLVSSYAQLMNELVLEHFAADDTKKLRYFFAGGGGYALPRAVTASTPAAEVTVAEVDEAVTEVAKESMYLDTSGMRIIHEDARMALQRLGKEQFEVIINDVFHDISIPYHLLTLEFAKSVEAHLAPDGLYLINVVDAYQDPKLLKSLLKTLKLVFTSVEVWSPKLESDAIRMTFVISAGKRSLQDDVLKAARGLPRTWVRITEQLLREGAPISELPTLTDNYVPVESLLSDV